MLRRVFRRILTPPMVVLAALFIFVEEWLWVRMTAAMAWVTRWPVILWLEARLARLPAWAAVVCFFLPGLMLLPVKIGALFLMGRGHVITGVGVIVAGQSAGDGGGGAVFRGLQTGPDGRGLVPGGTRLDDAGEGRRFMPGCGRCRSGKGRCT